MTYGVYSHEIQELVKKNFIVGWKKRTLILDFDGGKEFFYDE